MNVVIIGSGFAGIAAAIELRAHGIRDITILERADALGGVWRENTYPGSGCDVPAPYYSLSYAMNPYSSNRYTVQSEILAYLNRIADQFGIRELIEFGTEVTAARFDEPRGEWVIGTTAGREYRARVLVPAVGQLSRPAMPRIPGMTGFTGHAFHSARWDHDIPLRDKRIAVIGTGASAIQFVPRVQPLARRLTVFQRSAPYILPKPDTGYGPARRALFRFLPQTLGLERLLFWSAGELSTRALTGDERVASIFRGLTERFRAKHITDPVLRAKLTPDYPIGCKRVLFSNDYYPAMTKPNVTLETTPIDSVTPSGVRTEDGAVHEADVLIYGTGFSATDFLAPIAISGRGGHPLSEEWRSGAHAYLGMTVPGFPNMFCMYGPNTNLGSGSILYMVERQARYLAKAATFLARHPGADLEVDPAVERRYDEEMQSRLAGSAWSGCTSWYRQADGRVPTNWPGNVSEYHRRTKRFDLNDYRIGALARA
ncbi:flavin-containing monooxygenase [Sciscionella sediminilitoris]|uniref:flavin-containing monooxygenase n=1 Tax=Sciscionella sediminilitoris TaxID=1445613 RepID=UPI0004DFBE75|nr:NAD(P)/FAD-dependent oxidoreductase [Sciscionella sp. SE31]